MQLKPKSYNYIDDADKRERYGFIAQEVEKLYPNIVKEGANGMKSLNYDDIIPLAIGNIQDIRKNIPNNNTLCLGDVCINQDELRKLKKAISG